MIPSPSLAIVIGVKAVLPEPIVQTGSSALLHQQRHTPRLCSSPAFLLTEEATF